MKAPRLSHTKETAVEIAGYRYILRPAMVRSEYTFGTEESFATPMGRADDAWLVLDRNRMALGVLELGADDEYTVRRLAHGVSSIPGHSRYRLSMMVRGSSRAWAQAIEEGF